ncbi:SGNH/GDSL hydrolase family protein [Sphingomonas sp. RS6]
MKIVGRLFALILLFVAPCASAQSLGYSGLYVFGDSLVDSGNAYLATGGVQASPGNGYFGGRFSNGFNFADYLSIEITGAPSMAALAGGTNFAVGGADAEQKPGQVSPSFLDQILLFGSLAAAPIPNDALVLVTFGGNDVRDTILTGGPIDFSGAGEDLATGLGLLYGLGARNFVVTGSPDIGLLPVSVATAGGIPGRIDELTERSQAISAIFAAQTAALAALLPGANATFFDLFALQHAVLDAPEAFGFPANFNTSMPCQIPGGGSPQVANCLNSLYFDAIHPTTQIHAAIAGAIVDQMTAVPEAEAWLLMIIGFAALGAMLRRREAMVPRIA